jgi:hypothetical protein
MYSKLYIRLEGGSVVIEDASGVRGGNLKVSTGDDVRWINQTNGTCKLSFAELQFGSQKGMGQRVWPFFEQDPGADLPIPAAGWCGTFKKSAVSTGAGPVIVVYDVIYTDDEGSQSADPIIIIEN